MNRKIILLPLVLSALVLAGCGETGTSSTTSSEEATSSTSSSQAGETTSSVEETTSSSEEETTSSEPTLDYTPISQIALSEAAVTTRGQVVAKSKQAVIIHDGTAGLYIYGKDYPSTVNVGDYVEVKGSVSSYNGLLQMAWNGTVPATITKVSGQIEGTIPAPTALTAEIANGWATNTLTQADVKAYTWRATAGLASGKFTTLNIEGCSTDIEPAYHDYEAIPLDEGKTYDVTAYFVGFHNYISILVTEAKEVGSSTEEPDEQTFTKLADVIKMADDTTFTSRAYYVGRNSKAADKGGMTYNAVYVADGATPYMIYNASQETIDGLNLVAGESIVEFSGYVSNYGGLYECRLDSIKVVDDATGLEAPVYQTLDKDHNDIDLANVMVSTKFNVSDALVKNITTSGNDTTITFTVGEGTKEYGLLLDSRYNDMTPVENLKAGDTFKTETFLNVEDGAPMFTYIANFAITAEGEGGSTEEPEPEPEPTTPDLSNPTAIEISAIATTSMDENVVYTTTGILEDLDHADQYGNSYLVDPETGATLQLYGNTTSTSAFVFDEDGNLDYVNPKDAVTTLADVNNGEKVTILFQYSNNFKNAYSVTTAHEACADAYTVQLPTLENAAIEVNPTSGTYGTEATLTITPDSGFDVTSVTIDHGYGKETLKAAPYTFEIEAYNKVEVALRDTSVVVSTYTLTVENFENVSSYGNYTGSVNMNGTDVGLAANQIMRGTGANDGAIQMRNKDNNPSYVYNTVALPAAIVSIEVTFSSEMTREGQFGISVGTSELANAPESISWTGTTYTYTPSVSDATYFTIGHAETGTNAMYIASIVITIAA